MKFWQDVAFDASPGIVNLLTVLRFKLNLIQFFIFIESCSDSLVSSDVALLDCHERDAPIALALHDRGGVLLAVIPALLVRRGACIGGSCFALLACILGAALRNVNLSC